MTEETLKLIYALGDIVAIAILFAIARWVLAINHFVKSSKKQINLLILIAKKNGATDEEVLEVIKKAGENNV